MVTSHGRGSGLNRTWENFTPNARERTRDDESSKPNQLATAP